MPYTFKIDNARDIWNDRIPFEKVFPDAKVPQECKSGKDIVFHVFHKSEDYVNAGDSIIEVIFYRTDNRYNGHYNEDVIGNYFIHAETSGYVIHQFTDLNHTIDDLSRPFCIYSTIEELLPELYSIQYEIEADEFTTEKTIKWTWESLTDKDEQHIGFMLKPLIILELTTDNNMPVMALYFSKKYTNARKKDSISFKFLDGQVKSFPVLNSPVASGYSSNISKLIIPVTRYDIEQFSTCGWGKMRIEHYNGDAPELFNNKASICNTEIVSQALFMLYSRNYLEALKKLGITPKDGIKKEAQFIDSSIINEEACYVYLMVDTTNGFHKIGISNHPDYREKTLQSEKPTIEKICAKKYPSRLIAQSIEAALHNAFSAKRIRGEWFDLNETEVSQIIATLS